MNGLKGLGRQESMWYGERQLRNSRQSRATRREPHIPNLDPSLPTLKVEVSSLFSRPLINPHLPQRTIDLKLILPNEVLRQITSALLYALRPKTNFLQLTTPTQHVCRQPGSYRSQWAQAIKRAR